MSDLQKVSMMPNLATAVMGATITSVRSQDVLTEDIMHLNQFCCYGVVLRMSTSNDEHSHEQTKLDECCH